MDYRHKVGLFIKPSPSKTDGSLRSVFTNGCIQQAYFLYKTLLYGGISVEFLSTNPEYKHFEMGSIPITTVLNTNLMSFAHLDLIIFCSGIVSDDDILKTLKKNGTKLVNLICGNLYSLFHEEFVFDSHRIMSDYFAKQIDEYWILPMYSHHREFIELYTEGIPTRITPYVWDREIVDLVVEREHLNLVVPTKKYRKINFAVFEPNMSTHKTALVPFLMVNEFYRRYPDRMGKLFMFSIDGGGKLDSRLKFFSNFQIYKDSKMEVYGRCVSINMLSQLCSRIDIDDAMPVVISHTNDNKLNFLHLEMFSFGIPIIHNCEPFAANGLYYSTDHVRTGVELAAKLCDSEWNRELYMEKCRPILEKYNTTTDKNIAEYVSEVGRTTSYDRRV